MRSILKSASIIFILFFTVTSCNNNDEPTPAPPIVYDTAELLTRNYLTDDSGFDWLVNGTKISTDLKYGLGSKGTFQWNTDSIAAVILSINIASTTTELFSANIPVEKDKSYYSGLVGSSTAGTVVLIENDLTAPATGNVRIRFLHAYQDIEPVDIYIGGTAVDNKKVTNLDFSDMSNYVEVSHADVSASIIVTKTDVLPNPATDLLTIEASTTYESGKIYQDALASVNTDATSALSLFVTVQ